MRWLGWVFVAAASIACGRREPTAGSGSAAGASGSVVAAAAGLTGTPAASKATTEFWSWFATNAAALRADKDILRVMRTINEHLEPGHPGIFIEIGKAPERLLVISADGDKNHFRDVEAVYAARPTVPGWKIVAFRPRDPDGFTTQVHGFTLDAKEMKFDAYSDGDKLALSVYVPHFVDKPEMTSGLFIVLDRTIGEYDVETRISSIHFAPIEGAPASAKPLLALPAVIDERFAK